ncbi:MAG: hypothetical protein WC378_14665 [Opitutaceae bacterium]|jgi:hypothetical protein
MTDQKIRDLVTKAVILDRNISEQTEDLKALKAQIATEAESRADEATKTDGGGLSLTFEGADGCIARVTTAGPTLRSTLKPDDKKLPKIKEAARGFFARLFETEVVFKPVENFRDQARTVMGVEAAKLIKLCESAGKTTVSFETKDAV